MFIVGIDLGRRQDYTAISVVEPTDVGVLQLRHMRRIPLGTEYPHVENEIADLVRALPGRPVLVVDGTGVGDAVVAHLRGALVGLADVYSVWFTSGSRVNRDGPTAFKVPKKMLAGAVDQALRSGKLKFAKEIPNLDSLLVELKNFTSTITAAGNVVLASNEVGGVHDDQVMSVALAVWFAVGFSVATA